MDLMQTAITQPAMLTHGHGHLPAAGRVWLRARYGDGPLAGRVCRADRGGRHAVCRCAGSRGRARRRDDQGQLGRQRLDGRGDGPLRGGRADAQGGRRLRRRRQHQQQQPERDRRREQGRRAGDRALHREGLQAPCAFRSATPSTRRSSRRPASRCARCSTGCSICAPQTPAGRQRHRRALPDHGRGHQGHPASCRSPRPCSGSRGWRRCTPRACAPSSRSARRRRSRALSTTCWAASPTSGRCFTNHPKTGELPTFNQALCGLYAAGYGAGEEQPWRCSARRQS